MGLFRSKKKTESTTELSSEYPLRSTQSTAPALMKETGIPPPRTPSPTPSDIEELQKGALDWKKLARWDTWAKKEYIKWYIALVIFGVIIGLITLYHKQLVEWLRPAAEWMKDFPAGWVIPIAIMFVLSFPPLFGHEIIAVLCGIVWGLWIGFGIVAAGTFIGEIGNFYAFRYVCQARGDKIEKSNLSYACLAKVIREGGFLVALVARYSAIPGHFTTAIFSTCGMGIWEFTIGAFLSLPKQLVTVYMGVIIYEAADGQSKKEKIVSACVLVVTTLATILSAWWIYHKMSKAKPEVLRLRRKERAMALYQDKHSNDSHPSDIEALTVGNTFNPRSSSSEYDSTSTVHLPLSVKPQRWDANGRAILDDQNNFQFNDGSLRPKQQQRWNNNYEGAYPSSGPGLTAPGPAPEIMLTTPSLRNTMASENTISSYYQSRDYGRDRDSNYYDEYNPYAGDPNYVAAGGAVSQQQRQNNLMDQYYPEQQEYQDSTSRAERWEQTDGTVGTYQTASSSSPPPHEHGQRPITRV
ncbi:Tlg2-vesicle protein [Tulasnella sp. 419]|nr:Tlg2-vesicle protein [Tulasnella sp. 419]